MSTLPWPKGCAVVDSATITIWRRLCSSLDKELHARLGIIETKDPLSCPPIFFYHRVNAWFAIVVVVLLLPLGLTGYIVKGHASRTKRALLCPDCVLVLDACRPTPTLFASTLIAARYVSEDVRSRANAIAEC